MHVLILRADLHLPAPQSLKAKRSIVSSMIRHLDAMAAVAAAEVDHHELWQRTTIGITVVSHEVGHLESVRDSIERYLWSRPDIEVADLSTTWWDEESADAGSWNGG